MLGRLGFHEKWIGSNEVVEEAKRKKKCTLFGYEKVYDSVNWEFFTCLRLSFHEKWIRMLSLLGVAYKIFNVGRLCFLVLAQPKLFFGRHRHVLIYSARKTLTHLGKKSLFSDTDWKKKR